jgi:hypothetical protein
MSFKEHSGKRWDYFSCACIYFSGYYSGKHWQTTLEEAFLSGNERIDRTSYQLGVA